MRAPLGKPPLIDTTCCRSTTWRSERSGESRPGGEYAQSGIERQGRVLERLTGSTDACSPHCASPSRPGDGSVFDARSRDNPASRPRDSLRRVGSPAPGARRNSCRAVARADSSTAFGRPCGARVMAARPAVGTQETGPLKPSEYPAFICNAFRAARSSFVAHVFQVAALFAFNAADIGWWRAAGAAPSRVTSMPTAASLQRRSAGQARSGMAWQ